MPRDPQIRSVLVIGSGPIVIGQACEFDYSGTQAVKVLRAEGIRVSLVNSNPATIMTDPEYADRTYVEPLTPEVVEAILERERPDALLPTVGGQTALNLAVELSKRGVLDRLGVRLIGASRRAVEVGEDRRLFKAAMERIGLDLPRSGFAVSRDEALRVLHETGLPAVIRPSFTLGGTGGGIAYNTEEFEQAVARGLELSPVHEILIEESVVGWKEYELEVMRDRADNFVVICSIENFDPMGIHTGDSVTVAPAQTLSDREYQAMRDAARAIIREVGVETGGSNPVRRRSGNGADGGDRDEPPRLPLVRARQQGHRVPHRQDRRASRGRLPAGRDPERHHESYARVLRAGSRLCRGEDPAVGLREVPGCQPAPGHADEIRRGSDGDRADLQGGAPEGAAGAGDRRRRIRPG
jgi:formate-dependent phosphoribosylglycinamide formyltransferase (GAR transformylase)